MNPKRLFLSIGIILSALSCARTSSADILIVGGGASGISAGLQAARAGVRTVIVEETPWLGGMLTSAGVSCIDGNYNLRSGIFGEFADSLAARYGGWEALKTGWVSNINFEPQVGQEIFSNMAEECSDYLTVKRETIVKKVCGKEGGWEVTVVGQDGRKEKIYAGILIDATELGDIAKACGSDYRIGMESAEDTGESIAPKESNEVIQDLTYVAVLKDYGPDADMTIQKPEGYDPAPFANCAINPMNTGSETGQTIWSAEMMITYGKTPGGKYMINWPIYGNDYYVNSIEMSPEERKKAYAEAKNFTLCFIYFIQTELGMKNLGIADDVFPTEDNLPFFPYHRESRRIVGEAFLTLDAAASPYTYPLPYYRTGIAVGDYAVDHHHFRHPDWRELPDLHFYPIPSFNVPIGVILPEHVENLIVAEKSVSVSNLINGATRLQPVVMQLGQAAGALAAIAVKNSRPVKAVSVRKVQQELLESGCYIMPYLDLPKEHQHFQALQRIGATGILRGEGRNAGWANQTWFRADDFLKKEEIFADEYTPVPLNLGKGEIKIKEFIDFISTLTGIVPTIDQSQWWESLGLADFLPSRNITRLEAAVIVDSMFNPFYIYDVDYDGNLVKTR